MDLEASTFVAHSYCLFVCLFQMSVDINNEVKSQNKLLDGMVCRNGS